MSSIDKIKQEILNHPKVIRYQKLENIINNNEEIKELLERSKAIQKEIVHAEALNKSNQLNVLEAKYDEIMKKLTNKPLLMEYLDLQKEINDFLQIVKDKINDTLIANLSNNANNWRLNT